MSLVGKIQSLFLDREKTQPIFPITKVKAVSDDNGKGLNVLLDDKASKDFVTAKIAEAQLGGSGGEIDLSGFATKDDLNAVNNKIPTTPEQIGAHPDTWMPTVSDVGAAPAGYGLGEYGCDLPLVADADTCHKNGWYFINDATINGIGASAVMRVDSYSSTNIVQTAYCGNWTSAYFVIQQRIKHEGEWGEWEWINPPMVPGVEYRTTERYQGKAVYVAVVDIGTLPNKTLKSVEHNIFFTNIIRFSGAKSDGTGLSYDDGTAYVRLSATLYYIKVFTNIDLSDQTGMATIYYVK